MIIWPGYENRLFFSGCFSSRKLKIDTFIIAYYFIRCQVFNRKNISSLPKAKRIVFLTF